MTPQRTPGGAPVLSLADLEANDPQAPHSHGDSERRFLCPLCGEGKSATDGHRCLSLNTAQGTFTCYRCKASGKLREHWQERAAMTGRQRAQARLDRVCDLPPAAPPTAPAPEKSQALRVALRGHAALSDSPGAKYLQRRGVALDVADAARVRFLQRWLGRPAVMFRICDQGGAVVAAQGRYIDGRDNPKARTMGEKKHGVFLAPWASASGRIFGPLDAATPAIIITEAPLDALSLATAGYPALALCGTSGPAWLPKAAAFRPVLLALDADEAGDQAAANLAPVLGSFGARAHRLRPEGGKDWNQIICEAGAATVAAQVAAALLLAETS